MLASNAGGGIFLPGNGGAWLGLEGLTIEIDAKLAKVRKKMDPPDSLIHLEDHSTTCKWFITMVNKFPK